MKGRAYLWFISMVATLGGLMFGFDVGIISGAVPFIQPYFGWNELQLGWGVSSILVGAIVGAFGTGSLTEKYGRKSLLISVALFFAVSCAGMALATSQVFFISFRVLGGLAVGAVSVLSPMYVAEVAPPKIRGTLITIYQLAITLGILSPTWSTLPCTMWRITGAGCLQPDYYPPLSFLQGCFLFRRVRAGW